MSDTVYLSFDALHQMVTTVLVQGGLSDAQAQAVARVIAQAERDQCRAHGLYRIPGVLKTLAEGLAKSHALPTVDSNTHKGTVKIHAHGGFSSLSFETGLPLLVNKAKTFGLAAMAINDCVHFSALWPEVEALAQQGLAALAMCPSGAYVAPSGGIRKLLGTNPLAFAWPCTGADPYVFDFATSAVARGEIELHRLDNKPIPEGWAIDAHGQPTQDAAAGLAGALLTFGGHKGSAISTMIELLAGVWIGDLLSIESSELDQGRMLAPRHGELIVAFDPAAFGANDLTAHTQKLLNKIEHQGARLPSQRRFLARAQAAKNGIAVPASMLVRLQQLAHGNLNIELN